MKKLLVIVIIFLFLGVSLAPSINQSVVIASQDDDLVEVTSQACGIKGYKDTTVKLTREQYQNLKEYLVKFRAKLNRTTTRGEAVPIFKEAVVELNKYGLLPKGMSVNQAQNLVTRLVQNRNIMMRQNRFLSNEMAAREDLYNFICLIGGHTDKTIFENIGAVFFYLVQANFLHRVYDIIYKIFHVESLVVMGMAFLCYATFVILSILCMSIPLAVMNRINIGYRTNLEIPTPANGWVTTIGLFGNKKIQGSNLLGYLNIQKTSFWYMFYDWSIREPAVVGFFGIKIGFGTGDPDITIRQGKEFFYIGSALLAAISTYEKK